MTQPLERVAVYDPSRRCLTARCGAGHMAFGYGDPQQARRGAAHALASRHPNCPYCTAWYCSPCSFRTTKTDPLPNAGSGGHCAGVATSGNRRRFADAQARADESPYACGGIPPFFSHGVRATTASDGRAGRVLLPGSCPRDIHRRGATSALQTSGSTPAYPNIGPIPTFSVVHLIEAEHLPVALPALARRPRGHR
jgi:hypothetical protein